MQPNLYAQFGKNLQTKIVDLKNYFVSDADDFEPVVKPAGPPKAFQDKWEGEDEDDEVKVSVFLEGQLKTFKTSNSQQKF